MSYWGDIPSPKGFFNEQVKTARQAILEALLGHYIQNQSEPLLLGITVVSDFDAIQAALGEFHQKGWYAIAIKIGERNVVRIWEKEFDYESWLCEAGGDWQGGDDEMHKVIVNPNILDPKEEKLVTVCGKCKAAIDAAKAETEKARKAAQERAEMIIGDPDDADDDPPDLPGIGFPGITKGEA